MLTSLAIRYIALTKGVKPILSNNYWDRIVIEESIKFEHEARVEFERGITFEDRLDFEKLFGIHISVQRAFEEYISRAGFGVLDHWSIDLVAARSPHYAWMAETHVH